MSTLNFSEERDKLNVWIAYLALENRYGTPEKLNTILSRALGNCEGVQVYKRLAIDVYEKNEQFEVKQNSNFLHFLFFVRSECKCHVCSDGEEI